MFATVVQYDFLIFLSYQKLVQGSWGKHTSRKHILKLDFVQVLLLNVEGQSIREFSSIHDGDSGENITFKMN